MDEDNSLNVESSDLDICERDKFLIFTTGSKTYSPHEVGKLLTFINANIIIVKSLAVNRKFRNSYLCIYNQRLFIV